MEFGFWLAPVQCMCVCLKRKLVSDIAIFVLKRDVKLQLTKTQTRGGGRDIFGQRDIVVRGCSSSSLKDEYSALARYRAHITACDTFRSAQTPLRLVAYTN